MAVILAPYAPRQPTQVIQWQVVWSMKLPQSQVEQLGQTTMRLHHHVQQALGSGCRMERWQMREVLKKQEPGRGWMELARSVTGTPAGIAAAEST